MLLTLVEARAFYAIVEGFAAGSAVVALVSAFWAFLGWASHRPGLGATLGQRIADRGNYGIVAGFLPGCAFAAWVFFDAHRGR